MAFTVAQFRLDFPPFADQANYPESLVNFWATVAGKLLNAVRWSDLIDEGTELFVAHNLVLERQAREASTSGGIPGELVGAIQSESVDKASIS